ncbi:TLP-20 [Buzura suppressaria nucleopolyhedrovirus]|uniref:TLP-20 n=1 Tax=Buzura suppressaria nuclear polyhedrosis virus TaxID=74320 RepID=W5VL52_NPVBS|nr:TLP-20 [Buzura suppressaria nucleopolyhedrovirus]AHH82654.1 TLP-20 [Buzura suppressaria nucleopolyhedrovirus]
MTANNSGTVNILVYATLDQQDDDNILSFIVQDEYHLKKLAIGAYSLNILDTRLLNNLWRYHCATISCGNYVICHNFTEDGNLNVILFNTRPTILKKGVCIFKIIYSIPPNNKTMQVAHKELVIANVTENKNLDSNTINDASFATKHGAELSNVSVVDDDSISESNRRKFEATFTDHDTNSVGGPGDDRDTDTNDDDTDNDYDESEFNQQSPPFKKQKFNETQQN